MTEFKKYKHKESGEIVLLQIHKKQKSKYASDAELFGCESNEASNLTTK